ncbi:MAG: orotate phosphoribosyltransferase [Candidatus Cloacimonetes bacterium]|nr:orotate phosphoribosyltransferase [Candidatus Cloacimonadota bacterium]MBL7086253.1 orotate phosphoribosyltransferase [Candidatus Cloacimonadota bacterium]
MTEKEIEKILFGCGAFLKGHFLLTSGRHSEFYVEKIKIIHHPEKVRILCSELADKFKNFNFDVVISPAMGGIVLGYEVAKILSKKFIFTQRENNKMTIRNGFELSPNEEVLIIEDIVTTGGSVFEVIDCVKKAGSKIVGVGLIVDRSGGKVNFGVQTKPLLTLDIETFLPEDCPLCKKNIPIVKPGASNKKI